MPIPRTPSAARLRPHLAALLGPPPPDADLLARYVATRDETAFAELVRRHGPAVLAVCRRVTGNRDDADDAFQATFLVLARKAHRVRPAAAVGGWLYGVAVRAARKLLAQRCRRRDREVPVGVPPDVPQPAPGHDPEVVRIVLEEVARLTPAHRAALVLCVLEGRSRAAAARELGVPEGTLSSRLALARKALARRLRDRELGPAVLAAVLAAVAGAAGCPVLAADAARLAGVSDRVSPAVEKLTEAVMKQTFGSKRVWGLVTAVMAAAGLVVVAAEPPRRADPPPAGRPATPVPEPGGRLLLMKKDGFAVFTPEGKELAAIGRQGELPGLGWLSPDGKQIAYPTLTAGEKPEQRRGQVVVRDTAGGRFGTVIDVEADCLCWSPSGTELYATRAPGEGEVFRTSHQRIDLVTRAVAPLDWPDSVLPLEWTRDGKTVLVFRIDAAQKPILALMSPDGKTVTDLTRRRDDDASLLPRLSPDGRMVLFSDVPPGTKDTWGMTRRLYTYDRTTGRRAEVAEVPENATVFCCCWSPDGRKIAYTWRQRHADLVKKETLSGPDVTVETEMFLIVADADGRNARTVASVKTDNATAIPFLTIDWR